MRLGHASCMGSTVRHAARPSVRKDRGPFSFRTRRRAPAALRHPLSHYLRVFLASIDDAASRKLARRVRVTHASSGRGASPQSSRQFVNTLAHLRSMESRIELAFAWVPPIAGLSMIHRTELAKR